MTQSANHINSNTCPAAQSFTRQRFASTLLFYFVVLLALAGCRSYGVVVNEKQSQTAEATQYSLSAFNSNNRDPNLFFTLTFSGGGSRASALTYGVLLELRDTTITVNGVSQRLLDEVDIISSVSGGSFTAAYYGLYGDKIFDDFEELFLRDDPEKHLIYGLLNPLTWLDGKDRSESAITYFNKALYDDATFKDMMNPDRPMIIMNTSDLAYGIRFSFVQEYFDLLCSDLLSFPIARAVTASAAVPIMFTPTVIENYADCDTPAYNWVEAIKARSTGNLALADLADNLESYKNKTQRKYLHFVDGGITDNTGILALYDLVEMSGGINP